jgi:hypothetical protein
MRSLPVLAGALAGLAISLACGEADAFERQWHAGIGLGYAVVSAGGAQSGFGGGLHLTYGLTDAFNLMFEGDFTAHSKSGEWILLPSASLGVGYVIDILRWVPYVGLMAGAYDVMSLADGCDASNPNTGFPLPCHSARVGGSIPFGLDYQIDRSFAVGFAGRYHLLLGGPYPGSYLTLFGRAEYMWGF